MLKFSLKFNFLKFCINLNFSEFSVNFDVASKMTPLVINLGCIVFMRIPECAGAIGIANVQLFVTLH